VAQAPDKRPNWILFVFALALPVVVIRAMVAAGRSGWIVATAASLAGVAVACRHHFKQRRTRQRAVRGQCLNCGYNLKGSPERCPECGTIRDWIRPCLKKVKL